MGGKLEASGECRPIEAAAAPRGCCDMSLVGSRSYGGIKEPLVSGGVQSAQW